MLIVRIHNDGTAGPGQGNYDVEVLVTRSSTELMQIASGRVEGHERALGWRALLHDVADMGTHEERVK